MGVLKIAVVGDAMIDRYFVGEPIKLSAEAPIPVVEIDHTFDQRGGAANVTANLEVLTAFHASIDEFSC